MAHRRPKPGDVKTTDSLRLQTAVGRCLQKLEGDLRVQEHYSAWVARRDVDRLLHRARTWEGTSHLAEHRTALHAALAQPPTDAEIAALWQTLQTAGVRWPWTAPTLLELSFPTLFWNTARQPGEPALAIELDIEMVKTATRGRLPPDEGARIARHVDWWYRRKIKDPLDELRELEAEELARKGETTVSRRHSTILQGIQQAEALLERWTHPRAPLK